MSIEPKFVTIPKDIICSGLMTSTTDKMMMKDIPALYAEFMKIKENNEIKNIKTPWEYIYISRKCRPYYERPSATGN